MHFYYAIGWRLSRLLFGLAGARIYNLEHVPARGPFILASNHISYFDPPLVGAWIRRELAFFAKKELFDSPIMGPIVSRLNSLPVRRGTIDRHALAAALEKLAGGCPLTVFPEGTRSRTGDFLPVKPGIGLLARKAEVDVVPAFIHGSNRLKDCLLRREQLSVTYGPPIPSAWIADQPDSKEGYLAIAREVMSRIARIKQDRADRQA
jgi:1-acyl-sn-glycerol-3-phosphate acyltransferase